MKSVGERPASSSRSRRLRPASLLDAAAARLRRTSTRYLPPSGLSIPLVTLLDAHGRLLAEDQRNLVRYTIQQGNGANILFAAGTTGEWNRVANAINQAVAQIVVEECHRRGRNIKPVEAWVGITAHTTAETIANLEHAIAIGADAVVVAPLSIKDAAAPVAFMERTMSEAFDRVGRTIPVFLYDNAEIAAAGKAPHLHTREVKRISQLPWVYGVKVTAGKTVLGNYTRAASHFKRKGEFAIYPGNAYLLFDLFRPAQGVAGRARNYWNRYLTRNSLPSGVVCGAANVFPREWQRSWQVCSEHELSLMERYGGILKQFADICAFERDGAIAQLTIACTKTALKDLGLCSSDAVAAGTQAFEAGERREFLRRFRDLRRRAAAILEPEWLSAAEAGDRKPARASADA